MGIVTPNVVPASVLLAEPQPAWLICFAEFARALDFDDLDAALVAQAKLVLLDCIGAVAAGMQEPETHALVARLARRGGQEGVAAIGAGRRLRADDAAFANGVAGTMLELDEGNSFARGHPGIHVLPAALAARPLAEVNGRDFLLAFILGYEVGARVGAASRLRPTVHPHGTWGTVGAAFATAYLDGADTDALVETINVASTLSIGASLRAMLEGATVRNSFAGFSARNGLSAWDLVASGFTGEIDGVRTVYSGILAEGFNPDVMVEELGARWEIQRNYFKRHAACRFTHGALDVVAKLLAAHGPIDPAEITGIDVVTYVWAAQLDGQEPANMLAAKFSLPFAVATTIAHGSASVPAFRAPALGDARIVALAKRVKVDEDPAMSAMLPDKRPARVTIRLADGRVLAGETFTNRGDAVDPYGPDEVVAKFMELAVPVWGESHANRIRQAIDGLDEMTSLTDLDALLAEPALEDH
ncbi:MmgE/PrpD family protein [Chelatococcus asaccharovorans]|uniref:2-methylcitrate dehydratase PrpD n=1 Tax=Chelatococcus asaccharovorans TaxID=28210 RepID=A0A2V3UHK5_9HYPH|nr:MmgE/PrpD family protein [Chelatococcus asaccharovorans]MBS7706582.1 MmgE/PrpD family protein [Chelatococcus asaccharovorans]PXW64771.1 2-methylcitrate dehydratase PrpD [Chelatococcus asaccharovorans]